MIHRCLHHNSWDWMYVVQYSNLDIKTLYNKSIITCTLLSPLLIIHIDSFLQGKDLPIFFKKCQSHLNSCFPVLFVTVAPSWNTFLSLLWLCNSYHLFSMYWKLKDHELKDHFNSVYSLKPVVTIKDHTFLRVLVVCAFITHLITRTCSPLFTFDTYMSSLLD